MWNDTATHNSSCRVHESCQAPPTHHISTVQSFWQVQSHHRVGLADVPELTNQMTAGKHVTLGHHSHSLNPLNLTTDRAPTTQLPPVQSELAVAL